VRSVQTPVRRSQRGRGIDVRAQEKKVFHASSVIVCRRRKGGRRASLFHLYKSLRERKIEDVLFHPTNGGKKKMAIFLNWSVRAREEKDVSIHLFTVGGSFVLTGGRGESLSPSWYRQNGKERKRGCR